MIINIANKSGMIVFKMDGIESPKTELSLNSPKTLLNNSGIKLRILNIDLTPESKTLKNEVIAE